MKTRESRNKSLGLKAVSLLMALMLWFYVVNQGGLATGKNMVKADLNYYNVPAGLTVVGPRTVSVKLWGSYNNTGDIVAYVDLAGMGQGKHRVPVKVKTIKGTLFATVQPDKVNIELQELEERILPVQYDVKQKPADGLELREIIISPEKCLIRGERAAVKRVAVIVAPLNLSNSKGIGSLESKVQAKDSQGNVITTGIKLIPETVKVYTVVESAKELKKLPVKAQFKGKAAEGFRLGDVTTDPAQVDVIGEKSKLDSLTEILCQEIDITDKKESFTQTVSLQVPEGVTASPMQVNVNISIEKINDKGGSQ